MFDRRGAVNPDGSLPGRFMLERLFAGHQKFREEPEATKVGERIIREIVKEGVEIGDAVFQNRDPRDIQSIGAVQIVHSAASDDGIKRHQLTFIGIRKPRPASLAMCIPDRSDC